MEDVRQTHQTEPLNRPLVPIDKPGVNIGRCGIGYKLTNELQGPVRNMVVWGINQVGRRVALDMQTINIYSNL